MKKIKWENILTLLLVMVYTYQLLFHYTLNGFYIGILAEIVLNIMIIITLRYLVKDIRTNPENWK